MDRQITIRPVVEFDEFSRAWQPIAAHSSILYERTGGSSINLPALQAPLNLSIHSNRFILSGCLFWGSVAPIKENLRSSWSVNSVPSFHRRLISDIVNVGESNSHNFGQAGFPMPGDLLENRRLLRCSVEISCCKIIAGITCNATG